MHLADAFIQSDLHCIQVTVLHLARCTNMLQYLIENLTFWQAEQSMKTHSFLQKNATLVAKSTMKLSAETELQRVHTFCHWYGTQILLNKQHYVNHLHKPMTKKSNYTTSSPLINKKRKNKGNETHSVQAKNTSE